MAKYPPKNRIGHDKLQKIWNKTEKNTVTKVTKESIPCTADEIKQYDQQSDLQNRILKEMPSPEDVFYNLEIIAEQTRKHTELLSCILEKQREQKDDIESLLKQQEETQVDIAEEE